jgi:glutamate-1-semialdehyde 2,1-aminomutase
VSQHASKSQRYQKSRAAFADAQKSIPGGVNSPVRAFRSVGGDPVFIKRARGAYLWDIDQNQYIDYVGSWGPAIVGHAHPEVLTAISAVAENGISFGAPTELETLLANKIKSLIPSIDLIRFVSSGTEACMASLRVARGYTSRSKIIKFEGCYHGHGDMLLVKAGSGAATLGVPDSRGVPESTAKDTLTVPYNDLGAVAALFESMPQDIAAVIVEPIVGNSGFIRPVPGFLEGLRDLCTQYKSVLIFDEVMTGFRVGLGGVQALHQLTPDLTCFGKVIGGGMPLAAYGGKAEIMSTVAPLGPVYQAGTLSGNPLAVTCGLKTLELISKPQFFADLTAKTKRLVDGLRALGQEFKIPITCDFEGGMFGYFFHQGPVRNYAEAKLCNVDRFKEFFWGVLDQGVYMAPSAFEAGFVSQAHTLADIDQTLAVMKQVLGKSKS